MIGSTEAGLKLTTGQFDRFNQELAGQIKPHLEKLELTDALLKFTGDGWLLMTNDEKKVPALCCLAIIMASRFQGEMAEKMSIFTDRIPGLRLALCSGRDVRVQLPNGSMDWVGDSARRATRAQRECSYNEILIDDTVRGAVLRDFHIEEVRWVKGAHERGEEDFPVYPLGEIKTGTTVDPEAPEYFVRTLDVIGKGKEAQVLAKQAARRLAKEAYKTGLSREDVTPRIRQSWNRLLASLSNYSFALEILRNMRVARLAPDVVTYSILINKSPDYQTAKNWLETMRAEGIQPNVVTYNTLIAMAPDYQTAKNWLEAMRAEDIHPDVVTYNTVIAMAPDYQTAKNWLQAMRAEGIQPNVVTSNTLIAMAPDYQTAKNWLEAMRAEGIQADVVTYSSLIDKATYEEAKNWLEAMRAEGIHPDVVTYNTVVAMAPDYDEAKNWLDIMCNNAIKPDELSYSALFSKNLSRKSADEILKWYLAQEYHPEAPIEAAIAAFRRIRGTNEALRLALDYPHLPAALKLIRQYPDAALQYFKHIFDDDPNHPNAAYALGVGFFELGRFKEAESYLDKALNLAIAPARKAIIEKRVRQIRERRCSNK